MPPSGLGPVPLGPDNQQEDLPLAGFGGVGVGVWGVNSIPHDELRVTDNLNSTCGCFPALVY